MGGGAGRGGCAMGAEPPFGRGQALERVVVTALQQREHATEA